MVDYDLRKYNMDNAGVIYTLTNPSFPEYVKIGYADDIDKRLQQLNRSECIPFAFRVYATYVIAIWWIQVLVPLPEKALKSSDFRAFSFYIKLED